MIEKADAAGTGDWVPGFRGFSPRRAAACRGDRHRHPGHVRETRAPDMTTRGSAPDRLA